MKDWRILGRIHGQEIFINQILTHEQLGISNGAIDVVNATFKEAKMALKRIVRPHAFVENE
jgi:hypothetical protein